MDERKGFNRVKEDEERGAKDFFARAGLFLLSIALAVFTVVVINI